MSFIVCNGKTIEEGELSLSLGNRAFRYGDALFESIRIKEGKPLNLDLHLDRINRGIRLLKMNAPSGMDQKTIGEAISGLSHKNQLKEGRARMVVFRNGNGLYVPENNDVTYIIETSALYFETGNDGLKMGIYSETKKPIHLLSNLKTANCLQYVLAGIYKQEKGLDDCLILNEKGNIAEAISSNVFFLKENSLFTPSGAEGCVLGVMRQKILSNPGNYFDDVVECEILPEDLAGFDEAYLSNAVQGVTWVKSIENHTYGNKALSLLDKVVNSR